MFLFLRMVLAHLIADYPLQTNRIYTFKISGLRGQLFHAGIHTLVFSLFLIPLWHHPLMWVYLGWIATSHLFFDILKVQAIDKTSIHPVITYTGDQILHILAASAVLFFPFAETVPPATKQILFSWYWNDCVVIYLIGLLFATYFTTYFLACWHWAKKNLEHDDGYQLTTFQKYYGITERGIMMTLIALCGYWGLVSIPVLLALRLPVSQWLESKGSSSLGLKSIPDMVSGTVITVATGIIIQSYCLVQS